MEFDKSFLTIVGKILNGGVKKSNRTGVDTYSIFNETVETPELGFKWLPISKIRQIYYHGAIIEALWILGIHQNNPKYIGIPFTNTKYLEDNKVRYWRHWQDRNGNLGPVYGEQLCRWKKYKKTDPIMDESDVSPRVEFVNQIQNIIDTLKTDRYSRRLVCSMWNPGEIDDMKLPPCHYAFEFYVRPAKEDNEKLHDGADILDMRWIQRSCDMLIGIPYNVLIYAIIQKVVALCSGLVPGKLYGCLGDCHIYEDQIEFARDMFKLFHGREYIDKADKNEGLTLVKINNKLMDRWRSRLPHILPTLHDINPDGSDFEVIDYTSLPKMDIPVSV